MTSSSKQLSYLGITLLVFLKAMTAADAQAQDERNIPYQDQFGPSQAPERPLSPGQTPLEPAVKAALDVLYQRPSPKGPKPILLKEPQGIVIEGGGALVQVLPGPPAFPEKIPKRLKTVSPQHIPFSNNVQELRRGTFRAVAYDRTANDTKLSEDSMEVEITFTDHAGDKWRIEQAMLTPLSPNPIAEPWFGGVAIDTAYHGSTANGTPAVPQVRCMLCSWGWADIYKNGKRVASSAPLHVMLTSDTRGEDFTYSCYECAEQPVREVHVVVPPSAYLPSPGGFLHVMWEDAKWTRGSPNEIESSAPDLQPEVPTIELKAAPHLRWDKKEIRVKAGQKYRLVVHNEDPSSFHQFKLHSQPVSHEKHGKPDMRHEEGMTSGGIGPLLKPDGTRPEEHASPPAPKNVFFALPQGSTWATFGQFDKAGEYEFMCPVGNHYRRGMEGKFIVASAGGK
ncbi:MAG: hypothetical protein WD448_04110 [Woeseia sp.]